MSNKATQFKPHNNANPNGRPPKGYSITEMMKSMLESTPELKASICKVIAKKALEGDITAVKMLWNYMDGMPKQPLEHSGQGGGPIQFVVPTKEAVDELEKLYKADDAGSDSSNSERD